MKPLAHRLGATALASLFASAVFWLPATARAEKAVPIAPPAFQLASTADRETAVFAGGCFWGVQAVFQHTKGVLNAVSGYAGGTKDSANYAAVSRGNTAHAEAVQVTYDPKQISYGKLLQIYFSVAHDPTQVNRQGPDAGTQYRSAVFYGSDAQKQVTERYIAQLDGAQSFGRKIATQVAPLDAFYPAEAYHQDYATNNPYQPYILMYDKPKIASLKTAMPDVFREKPVLVAGQAK